MLRRDVALGIEREAGRGQRDVDLGLSLKVERTFFNLAAAMDP